MNPHRARRITLAGVTTAAAGTFMLGSSAAFGTTVPPNKEFVWWLS